MTPTNETPTNTAPHETPKDTPGKEQSTAPQKRQDFRLELVILPVSDVDAAKAFYVDQVGFIADHDQTVSDEVRFVQLTPRGSACSIAFGKGLTDAEPGSVKGLQVVVDDAQAAYDELSGRGVAVDGVEDMPWGRFVFFADPDGNKWSLQELPTWG
jgi:catechol 2,3-dioxygenase-like lactoylglutathione lyase family enzyme